MNNLILIISFLISNTILFQNSQNEKCSSISHEVNPVYSCNLSTNTSVDIVWDINCPNNNEIKNGITVMVQFMNKYGRWNFPKTKSIPSNTGSIKINFSGLKFNTSHTIRYFAYPSGMNVDREEVTKLNYWKEYQFDIPSCR